MHLSRLAGRIKVGVKEYESLEDWILHLRDVTQASHRFGGVEFRVKGLEFMHFHGTTHLDIRLSRSDQARMLEEGKAEHHLYAPQAGWVTFHMCTNIDLERAQELIMLAYNNARETVMKHESRKLALRPERPHLHSGGLGFWLGLDK